MHIIETTLGNYILTSPFPCKRLPTYQPPNQSTASVEQHIGLLLEDLSKLGSQSSVSAPEEMVLREAFLGLHYVWRMRVHENLNDLSRDLMDRLRMVLLLFLGRVVLKGPAPFLARSIPAWEAVFALVIFCGMVKDCTTFRETVNDGMTVADIRRALAIHQVCRYGM